MKISNRIKNGYQIFDILGNIAFEETQDLEEYVYQNLTLETEKIILNLQEVPYLNSSTLGAFVRMLQTLKAKEIGMYIMNINEDIRNLFIITGVTKYFEFINSEDEI